MGAITARAARTRLADALDRAHEGFLLFDAVGRVVAANARMADFFPDLVALLVHGTSAARLSGAILRHVLVGEASRRAKRVLRERLLAIAEAAVEVQLRDARWLRISGCPTDDGGVLVTCIDITVARAHEAALSDRDIVLDRMSQGICMYAPDATVRLANKRYAEVLCVDPSLARPGATMRELLAGSVAAGNHGDRSLEAVEDMCLGLVTRQQRRRLVLTLASKRLVAFDHIPLEDGGWLATFEDITDQRRLEDRANFLARHDALTELPNRSVLRERLAQAIALAGRGEKFALLCANLDRFKTINDTMGHGVGDLLLRAAGERLAACVRETDLVCRLGGDEFAIVQSAIALPEQSGELAQRVMRAFATEFVVDGHVINVGLSIGIAIAPDDGARGELLLRRADSAMVRAKRDGGGTFRLFEPEIDAKLQARRTMEADLRRALVDGEFEVNYQPLLDVATGRVTGFEALLRWRHPDGSMVPPAQFIPISEETGLIVAIGEWVLQVACAAAAGWPMPLRVAVNVSPVQFKSGDLAADVMAALNQSGLSPRRLELEITESVLLAENAATLDVLRGLRAHGVRISMDDFGTGYSSLSYLRSFPFDKIKIDQSFVRDLEQSADSAAIVGAIVGLGRSLGMRVTAEGVETEGQLAMLRVAGCDEAQGYLFSRPRPGNEVPDIIARIDGLLVENQAGG